MRVLILAANGVEDLELYYPYLRLLEEGVDVDVAAPEKGVIKCKYGYQFKVDLSINDVKPEEYDGLILPGGKAPERIRIYAKTIEIVKHFSNTGKPIGAICHGPQVLISAGIIKGRRVTCYIGIRDDVIVAGGKYEDKEVVVDGNIVTSRNPFDLPYFMREFIKLLKKT